MYQYLAASAGGAGGGSSNYFLIEVNTETDFAANDQEFKKFLTELKEFCESNKLNDLEKGFSRLCKFTGIDRSKLEKVYCWENPNLIVNN